MVCDFDFTEGTMRVNCQGCIYGSSIEDFEACMAKTIDKLIEVKGVERIVFSEAIETEYDFDQVKMLIEIANAYRKIMSEEDLLSVENFGPRECEKYFPRRLEELQFLIQQVLRKDPVGAYIKLRRLVESSKINVMRPEVSKCFKDYLEKALLPIEKILSSCRLIKEAKPFLNEYRFGDRKFYRMIFHPMIRPRFMLTRYIAALPRHSKAIDSYTVAKDITVEIFKVPGKVRYIYNITPPEFRLSEVKYTILDSARRYLVEHKPKEADFAEPEKAREVFMNIGKGLIREISDNMGLSLKDAEVEDLATILARHTAGFGILEILLADDKIQDIFVNSPIGLTPIFIQHSDFEECETNLIPTKEDAEAWATRFRMYSGRPLDEANPVLDTELQVPGGRARVAAITKTLSPEGLAFAFRRHREKPWTFPLFIRANMFDPIYAGVMSFLAEGGRCILIAGGRASGKTSLLSSMLLEIMKKFRIILSEDTLELPIAQLRDLGYNIERLKSRSVITRIETELPAEEAIRTALRLGDACMIVGEVRSKEAAALFEAMRIGVLSNLVAGTIHAESAYGVYDRVVNDLGVVPTSFKACDIITICNMLRSPDGLHRFRRVTELTELRKNWKNDPSEEGGFVPLMEYSAKEDRLKPTDVLVDGESVIINDIAKRVREWHGRWDAVWENILLRGKIKETMVEYAEKLQNTDIIEAESVSECNENFHLIGEKVRNEVGEMDSKIVYEKWLEWFKERIKGS
ncbi:MAG TPA: type II/IV secretion system ATPase subunit [archaeon]|nr:type II/IV secretion system ATPase subunit [archaeon]